MPPAKPRKRSPAEDGARSPHAFMREALRVKARHIDQRRQLLRAALAAEEDALASGRGFRAADVDRYFEARGLERSAPLPSLRRWRE